MALEADPLRQIPIVDELLMESNAYSVAAMDIEDAAMRQEYEYQADACRRDAIQMARLELRAKESRKNQVRSKDGEDF